VTVTDKVPHHCRECLLAAQFQDPAAECPGSPACKADLRRVVTESLSAMTPNVRQSKSALIVKHLKEFEPFQKAEIVMAYVALELEVNPWQLMHEAWSQGKRVAMPRIHPPLAEPKVPSVHNRYLRACELRHDEVADPEDHGELRRDVMGILEPNDEAVVIPPEDIDLVLVPCMAFDRGGCRLGKGGGFYDRFLSHSAFEGTAVGLAFSEQVFSTLPVCPHDREVQFLATERGIIETGSSM
jgi:5-formyltetrahydrofolate cyclo-ligase